MKFHCLNNISVQDCFLVTLIFTVYGISNRCTHLIIKVFLIEVLRRKRSLLVDLTVGVTVISERKAEDYIYIHLVQQGSYK